jgi:signal peptidase II
MIYLLGAGALVFIDRITKWYALTHWRTERIVNEFLSFRVAFNRGVSWGLLHYSPKGIFIAITSVLMAITIGLLWYAVRRYKQGHSVIGETLVIAGSLSNIYDRVVYGAVVDFIVLRWGDLVWPVFNVADCAIVGGVIIMFAQLATARDS